MASSNPSLIPKISQWIWEVRPKSVLDVGIGFGRYGFLCREILEVWAGRYWKKDWQVKIDGVEPFVKFITPVQKYLYDDIIYSDIRETSLTFKYDLIIMGDIIEHMPKEDGQKVIEALLKCCKWMIIQTPHGEMKQSKVFGNDLEVHVSSWLPEDFIDYYPEMESNGNIFTVLLRGEL